MSVQPTQMCLSHSTSAPAPPVWTPLSSSSTTARHNIRSPNRQRACPPLDVDDPLPSTPHASTFDTHMPATCKLACPHRVPALASALRPSPASPTFYVHPSHSMCTPRPCLCHARPDPTLNVPAPTPPDLPALAPFNAPVPVLSTCMPALLTCMPSLPRPRHLVATSHSQHLRHPSLASHVLVLNTFGTLNTRVPHTKYVFIAPNTSLSHSAPPPLLPQCLRLCSLNSAPALSMPTVPSLCQCPLRLCSLNQSTLVLYTNFRVVDFV
ncbi:hypothetical protein OF83DRAFT_1169818 [Amylostereum chailletii]|nr:hypothetical protein OF83DRAFT_1169818 [Amylostereum chailletii]